MGSGTFNHPFSCSSFHKSTRCTTESLTWPCPHRTESKTKGLSQIHLNMNPKQKHVGRFPSFLNISLLQLLREALFPTFPTSSHSPQCLKEKHTYEVWCFLDSQSLHHCFGELLEFSALETPFFCFGDTTRASWQYTTGPTVPHSKFLKPFHLEAPEMIWRQATGFWRRLGSNLNYHLHTWTHISCIYIYIYKNI